MKEKRWRIAHADLEKVASLQRELKVHTIFCQLMVQRGVDTYQKANDFFNPTIAQLHDPFLMKDMDKAVARIKQAIEKNERILIYGDYDVDGTTSVATMVLFFEHFYPNIDYYIPDRYTEGYGISFQGIDFAKATDCSLIIALDCGIKSIDKVEYANQKGIDFIICDHHNPGDTLPDAIAVLDPKRTDCVYPFKELSGCGVGFKLTQALSSELGLDATIYLKSIDLVAVSIASDIVSMVGENRVIAALGLKKLNENPSHGLRFLKELMALDRPLDISDVVFYIGPRINAAGRMRDAKESVKLLIADDDPIHAALAGELQRHNLDRQEADRDITAHALALLESDPANLSKKSTVVFSPDWHKGVIGIVASRLTETYYRPTVVLTQHEGKVTGSARSVKGFDLYEALCNCTEHLIQFGGHKFAAGMTMLPEQVEGFKTAFETEVSRTILPEQLIPEVEVNTIIALADLTDNFYKLLMRFAPFGPDNMKPQFLVQNVQDTGWSKVVKEKHLKLSIRQRDVVLNGIGFDLGEKYSLLKEGNIDVVFQLEINEWQGKQSLQMMVKDIKKNS
jgi:single-stranded-DNA-specific exonuclease